MTDCLHRTRPVADKAGAVRPCASFPSLILVYHVTQLVDQLCCMPRPCCMPSRCNLLIDIPSTDCKPPSQHAGRTTVDTATCIFSAGALGNGSLERACALVYHACSMCDGIMPLSTALSRPLRTSHCNLVQHVSTNNRTSWEAFLCVLPCYWRRRRAALVWQHQI